tara:strand:- start:482 stop:934 length:453 start_codon:yes stop_codon:yes gene_type:complete
MDQDLQLFNNKITQQTIEKSILNNCKYYVTPFDDYSTIYNILSQHHRPQKKQLLKIYDYTTGLQTPGEIFPVNDHINRIGHNPFIGKQQFFEIDFINVEKLYVQHPAGVITNSCGKALNTNLPFPSSYLANIAMLGLILNYKIEGYLIHV